METMEMTSVWAEMIHWFIQNVLWPVLIIIGGAALVVVKSYADKIMKSVLAKNETESLENVTGIRNNLTENIDEVVEAAVSSTMSLAEEMKSKGKKLTEAEAEKLQRAARELIYDTLPKSLTEEDGALSKIIGGTKSLDTLVAGLIEKHVTKGKATQAVIKNGRKQI